MCTDRSRTTLHVGQLRHVWDEQSGNFAFPKTTVCVFYSIFQVHFTFNRKLKGRHTVSTRYGPHVTQRRVHLSACLPLGLLL